MLELAADDTRMVVLPEMGGGLGSLVWCGRDILRPWTGRVEDGHFALAMNLLAPFSNRISGPFRFGGALHDVPANLEGEPYAIHGDVFHRAWDVDDVTKTSVTMKITGGIGPWLHSCSVTWTLGPNSLAGLLAMTNRGGAAMPFGGGFHPWFPRHAGTRLQFNATGVWPEDDRHLPATDAPMLPLPDWRWESPAPLPTGWINAGFSGWDGRATIHQPDMCIEIAAEGLGTTILYSPSGGSTFFCFEPVSHPVDAHNLPGQPGLVTLEPGETLTLAMSLRWDQNMIAERSEP